jgi:hypothetical protein
MVIAPGRAVSGQRALNKTRMVKRRVRFYAIEIESVNTD